MGICVKTLLSIFKGSQLKARNECVLQALETVKILSGMEPCYSGSLFLFDGLDGRGRLVKLRGRREGAQVWSLINSLQYWCSHACRNICGPGSTTLCPNFHAELFKCESQYRRYVGKARAGSHALMLLGDQVD